MGICKTYRTHLIDISSNSAFSHFTQHFLSVSKQTTIETFFAWGKKKKKQMRNESNPFCLYHPPQLQLGCFTIIGLLGCCLQDSCIFSFLFFFSFSESTSWLCWKSDFLGYFQCPVVYAVSLSRTLRKSTELLLVTSVRIWPRKTQNGRCQIPGSIVTLEVKEMT